MSRLVPYEFAHQVIPSALFQEQQQFLQEILGNASGQDKLRLAWRNLAAARREAAPADRLELTSVPFGKAGSAFLLTFPLPQATREAYYGVIVERPEGFRYFLLERADEGTILGEWNAEAIHHN